jgi:hypothetical protein
MGQGSIAMSTPKPKVKASGITKDSPLYHAMNMLMTRLDELEKTKFGVPIVTLPYDGLAPFASQPQYRRLFHYHYDHYFTTIMITTSLYLLINLNWPLQCLKPIGPI